LWVRAREMCHAVATIPPGGPETNTEAARNNSEVLKTRATKAIQRRRYGRPTAGQCPNGHAREQLAADLHVSGIDAGMRAPEGFGRAARRSVLSANIRRPCRARRPRQDVQKTAATTASKTCSGSARRTPRPSGEDVAGSTGCHARVSRRIDPGGAIRLHGQVR